MTSPALDAALADIDTVFNGCTSPGESACELCHLPEEAAYLRTPYVRIPADVLRMYAFEVSDHFDDQAAAMRRLLPQGARALVMGEMEPLGLGFHGLAVVDWRTWPADQSAAVETFVLAWWADVLAAPEPPYRIVEIFELCASVLRSVTPLHDRWHASPVADAHLARCVDRWLDELLVDESPFGWFLQGEETAVPALRAWLAQYAPDRLRARDEPDLAKKAELLALPYDDRWAHPYWASPSATS
ncbi:hypothetical protein M2161_002647 [Streptomyces sp. SAI-133]|uniref:hypothetical protein n=1 Tax=unclassified Streptomyces TaxID=2593676 RepID=UPI002473D3A2|nr:hypothetical protein [Streptomyces sp. SAI-133]MDH6583541.1 hypothetical protein [Streptomyces sp. SAI-133]